MKRNNVKLVKPVNHVENDGHKEEQTHRGTDHRLPQTGRGTHADQGACAAKAGSAMRCAIGGVPGSSTDTSSSTLKEAELTRRLETSTGGCLSREV